MTKNVHNEIDVFVMHSSVTNGQLGNDAVSKKIPLCVRPQLRHMHQLILKIGECFAKDMRNNHEDRSAEFQALKNCWGQTHPQ